MKIIVVFLIALAANAQEFAQGWMGEFEHASKQIHQLLEATPEAQLAWRPAPGIRSAAEVYIHIIEGNYFLLRQAGVAVKSPPKGQVTKADIVKWLTDSEAAVRAAYPKADMKKAVKFLGKDTTVEGVFLRLLVHSHEHMGQLIAYARSSGVVPPWSAK
jgi:uncharacterized damage-inducible protein DinB